MRNLIQVLVLLFLFSVVTEAGDRKVKKEENRDLVSQGFKMDDPSSPWSPMRLGQPHMDIVNFRSMASGSMPGGPLWIAGATLPATGIPLKHFAWYLPKGMGQARPVPIPLAPTSATSTSVRFSSIGASGDSIAIVAGYSGIIVRTATGGRTWDTVAISRAYNASGGFLDGLIFLNPDTVVAYGDRVDSTLWIVRSLDKGVTWARVNGKPTGGYNEGNAISADSAAKLANLYPWGIAGSGATISSHKNTVWIQSYASSSFQLPPAILKSTDAGATWQIYAGKHKFGNRTQMWSVSFKNDSLGFAVTLPVGRLYKTVNGGRTWGDSIAIEAFTLPQAAQNPYSVTYVPNSNNIYLFGFSNLTGSKTWRSSDEGATWTSIVTPGLSNLNAGMFASDSQGIAYGYKNLLHYRPSVEVTFMVNTATVPDTLKSNSFVQIRGSMFGWNSVEGPRLTHAGGDYWKASIRFNPRDTMYYKLYTNIAVQGPGTTGEHVGWENDLLPINDRLVAIANSDSLLPLQYVNGSPTKQNMYWSPFKAHSADSIGVYFRVNMQGNPAYVPATHKVGVRGSGGTLDWGNSFILKQEAQHGNSGSASYPGNNIWSGAMYFKKPAANETLRVEYKFVRHLNTAANNSDPAEWESSANRTFAKIGSQPMMIDTTLFWKWFSDVTPRPVVTGNLIFNVDLSPYIKMGHFNKAADSLFVRGAFNGWSIDNKPMSLMQAIPGSNIYSLNIQHKGGVGDKMYYKFFIKSAVGIKAESGWELPLASGGGNRELVFAGTTSQQVTRQYNDVFGDNLMPSGLTLKLNLKMDLRPAMKLTITPFKKGVDTLKTEYTSNEWKEGITTVATYSDADGDSIYTATINYTTTKFTPNALMYSTKYTSGTAEGGGFDFGRYRVRYIMKTTAGLWPTEYSFPADVYTVAPPLVNEANPYMTEVKRMDDIIPTKFSLLQNYPNPFNPSTIISYTVPSETKISLRVFNLLGQEVATLVNEKQIAGRYTVDFNASKLASGFYIYRLEAGSVNFTKKMLLMK